MWVSNSPPGGGSVTELDAAAGAPVANGSSYRFDFPRAIDADGIHVWIANNGSGLVTELNAVTRPPGDQARVRVQPTRRHRHGRPRRVDDQLWG